MATSLTSTVLDTGRAFSAVDKSEWFHTSMQFDPVFEIGSEQRPEYDPIVYRSIVWDREYFVNAAFTFSFTLEVAHQAYYKFNATFTLLQLGFGVQDILFEQRPISYCDLVYKDSRFLQASLVLESNSKPCSYNFIDHLAWHWDSHQYERHEDSVQEVTSLLTRSDANEDEIRPLPEDYE